MVWTCGAQSAWNSTSSLRTTGDFPVHEDNRVRRLSIILIPFIFSTLLFWAYEASRLPPGVESKGEPSELIAWVSLAGSIVSLITGVVTLTLQILKLPYSTKRPSTDGDS
jgi:hypothetical protein